MPVAVLPADPLAVPRADDLGGLPGLAAPLQGTPPPPVSLERLVVLDLSSLWAGPLCGDLLADLS
jgi:hypothetical protein